MEQEIMELTANEILKLAEEAKEDLLLIIILEDGDEK